MKRMNETLDSTVIQQRNQFNVANAEVKVLGMENSRVVIRDLNSAQLTF